MASDRQLAMGVLFYPRGGSAQVARYLSRALRNRAWRVSLLSGSLGEPGDRTHAETFYEDGEVTAVDYNPALAAFRDGRDPMAEPVPLHPSFEDRPDVPDRVLAALSPELGDHQVRSWQATVEATWDERMPIYHLHHLTPLHEAVMRARPGRPIVSSLHGTETKMLDRIHRLTGLANAFGQDLAGMAGLAAAGRLPDELDLEDDDLRLLYDETRWQSWRHGEHWAERLRTIAHRVDRLVVNSPHERDEAQRLLGVEAARIECIPNGVDIDLFDRIPFSAEQRLARWRRWLVDEPRGWTETGKVGSIRYGEDELRHFVDERSGEAAPVLLFVGRFLHVKRVPLLVRAYAAARSRFSTFAPLVIWGGFPGEWEGEHPHSVAREVGEEGIFFAGWWGHGELPEGFACSDVMVGPSIKEGFGQVFLEAMTCGVPVIVPKSGGPLSFVNTDAAAPNGWLVEPDDIESLADAMVHAVNDRDERLRRSGNAYRQVRAEYAWDHLAERFTALYDGLLL